jgi:hypothetical protein
MTARLRPTSREAIRQLELRASSEPGMPMSLLMENADRSAAASLAELTGALSPHAGGSRFRPIRRSISLIGRGDRSYCCWVDVAPGKLHHGPLGGKPSR